MNSTQLTKPMQPMQPIKPIKPMKQLLIIIIIVMLPIFCSASDIQKIPMDLIPMDTKQADMSFAISAGEVLSKMKQKKGIVLIDVRSAEAYEKLRIPGSINMPLYAVKTKEFLKSHEVVLINKGYVYSRMEKECRSLKDKGFNVSILSGGLYQWKMKNGPLDGDLFAKKDLDQISCSDFFIEKAYTGRLYIDISEDRTIDSKTLVPTGAHVPLKKKTKKFAEELKDVLLEKKNNGAIVIFNQDGDYKTVMKIINKEKIDNVFYLKGGLKGYGQYLKQLTLARNSKGKKTKTIGGCKDCGE